jgi:hypothetical protein
MPSASQLAAVQAYAAGRVALASQEAEQLADLTAVAQLSGQLDIALATGDDVAVATLKAQLAQAESALATATSGRDTALATMASSRRTALGKGDGFELLSPAHPLLLLPVRLETRFAWRSGGVTGFNPVAGARVLLVRVIPDEIHEDAFEPAVTDNEARLLDQLRKMLARATDAIDFTHAWNAVVSQVGPLRAGWFGELLRDPTLLQLRPDRYTRPAVARLLPDRWVATVELDDGSTHTATSPLVREPLEMGLNPATADWMTDFGAAMKAGMGLIVAGIPDDPAVVRRLVVVGARGTSDPGDSATQLQRLLTAQHYARGISLPGPGTATNSAPGTLSGYTTRPELPAVVALESRRYVFGGGERPLCSGGIVTAGTELATALGLPVAPFEYVEGADATTSEIARTLRELMVRATQHHLPRLTAGIIDPRTLEAVLDFGIATVSPVGPFPALRVGAQPYGVLPILLRTATQPAPGSFTGDLLAGLDRFRAIWTAAAAGLDQVGRPGADPATTLVRILQQDAVARRLAMRPLLGPQSGGEVSAGLSATDLATITRARSAVSDAMVTLGAEAAGVATSPLLAAMNLPFAPPVLAPLVEHAALAADSPQRMQAYLEVAAALRPDLLLQHDYAGAARPVALLFSVVRLALLEAADAVARTALVNNGVDSARWEDEDVPTLILDPYGTPLARLQAPDPADPIETLAFHLSENGGRAADLAGLRDLIRSLKTVDAQFIEDLLRATLGLFSHRLDAWYTGVATQRLSDLRHDPATKTGINLAAYGLLEDIRQSPRALAAGSTDLFTNPLNGGFVHAPSAGHAVTAAVLRSAHLAHAAAGHGTAFSIDLSSARVRAGIELFDGVREGQPLPALLGYRVERALAEEGLQRFVAPLRSVAPLLANELTPSMQPAEAVAASNVVDGLALLTLAGYDGDRSADVGQLWAVAPSLGPLPVQDDQDGLARVLSAAQDALDSAADLAVAESVYQTVQGNPGRAGAAADGLAGAPVPPPEFAVARTPRTGVAVTHRLLLLLDGPAAPPVEGGDDSGWAWTPRALADPRIETWARASLPAATQIVLRVRFVDGAGAELLALDLTLAELNAAATTAQRPDLLVGARDLVQLADPQAEPGAGPLDQRWRAQAELSRPDGHDADVLELGYERESDWPATIFSIREVAEIARALRLVISLARPLAAEDVSPAGVSFGMTADEVEMTRRASTATQALTSARSALSAASDSSSMREALLHADLLGASGAAPSSVRDSGASDDVALAGLRRQVTAVLAELDQREAARSALAATDSLGQLGAVLGSGFTVLPVLNPADPVTALLSATATPQGATVPTASAWLSRAAQVRSPVEALDRLMGYAEATALVDPARAAPALHVGQIGGPVGERWVAVPPDAGASIPGGRVSVVAVTPGPGLPASVAGFHVDEWVEVVPSAQETTSLAFDYDAPSSEPPQVLLVGTPPIGHETWTARQAVQIVEEALALSQIRLVDVDQLSGIGQLVPSFVTAENPDGDAVGLDIDVLTGQGN